VEEEKFFLLGHLPTYSRHVLGVYSTIDEASSYVAAHQHEFGQYIDVTLVRHKPVLRAIGEEVVLRWAVDK
jgi:hypothetical protein